MKKNRTRKIQLPDLPGDLDTLTIDQIDDRSTYEYGELESL